MRPNETPRMRSHLKSAGPSDPTDIANKVRLFYQELPFNSFASARDHAQYITASDVVARSYPIISPVISTDAHVVDVGCGTGTLVNSINYRGQAIATGLDFNDVAISEARQVADILGLGSTFQVADFWKHEPARIADIAISIGVLHHTPDLAAAIRRLGGMFVRPGGYVLLGLYHALARAPLISHFDKMREAGASEKEQWDEFLRLHRHKDVDPRRMKSWFRDQVSHPHETMVMLHQVIEALGDVDVVVGSVQFSEVPGVHTASEALRLEPHLAGHADRMLMNGRFPSGLCLVLGHKEPSSRLGAVG